MKKVFLEISQNLQENTCARVSFLIKLHTLTHQFVNLSDNHSSIYLLSMRLSIAKGFLAFIKNYNLSNQGR